MNHKRPIPKYELYPAKYFFASPTYEKWVKLTVADVHGLGEEPGFEGQKIYFYLNHPIQYVYLVGPVVGIEDIGPRYTLLTLDDGSGACIDIKIIRKDAAKIVAGESNTSVANVDINSGLNLYEVLVDGQAIEVATIIKAKCTISSFRQVRQLELKRINIIEDTNREVAAWKATAEFKRDVLDKPWYLTKRARANLEETLARRAQGARDEKKVTAEVGAKKVHKSQKRIEYERKKREHDERTDVKRRIRLDQGALPGSNIIWELL